MRDVRCNYYYYYERSTVIRGKLLIYKQLVTSQKWCWIDRPLTYLLSTVAVVEDLLDVS